MQRIFVCRRPCGSQTVDYYLLVEALDGLGENYGLCLESETGRESIPGITVFPGRIQSLLEAMIQGAVTPVTARYVVEDWLAR